MIVAQGLEALQVLAAGSGGFGDPGGMEAPPGAEQIFRLIRWGTWIVFACCVAGVLAAAVKMAIAYREGGGAGVVNLAWTGIACVIASSATGIVGLLMMQ